MPDNSTDRRRSDRPSKTSKTNAGDDAAGAETAQEGRSPAPAGGEAPKSRFQANVAWALVTGLAVGFAVGREAHRFGLSDGPAAADDGSKSSFIAADSNPSGKKGYATSAEFPAGWVKDSDLANGATLFAGLTAPQTTLVMQALNERTCDCGCGFGSLAECLHKDPNCPNSPAIAKMAVELVKQGKGLDQLLTAIDDRQKSKNKPAAAAPAEPATPKYIEVAAWNPRRGPKDPKVTVVLFSDFQ